MVTELINGVFFTPITPITTVGGKVMHAIKGMDESMPAFGECYFSTCDNNSPKTWKKHSRMICNLFVPVGAVKFVFYDDRADSADKNKIVEFIASAENYGRLVINPGVWFGFAGVSDKENVILNVANILHDPNESQRLEPNTTAIPYEWKFD